MKRYLYLPKQYDLVVGDTFELFYRGIVNCASIDCYDFEIFYEDGGNRGKGFARKYLFTPTEADVGVHTMHIRLYNNEGEVLDERSVTVNIVMPPKSPTEERVVLLVGASDAGPGIWPSEVGRRLVGEGGKPQGSALANVSFIGSRERDGIRYEGYGGWTFASYSTANLRDDFMILTGDFRDKVADVDQHSFYADETGRKWKLESIAPDRIKIICESALGVLPSVEGGRLTHASGGQNHGDIVYTSAHRADANPFWSAELGRNDFKSYAARFGKERIDEIVVTLTWNSYRMEKEAYKALVRRFVESVHADYPACHITFVGGIFPSRDGFAQNYGISWPWFPMLTVLRNFDDVKEELVAEDPLRLSFVHLASQLDMDHNAIFADFEANVRSEATVRLGSNGLHLTPGGSLQIADAIWRHLSTRFG